MAVCRSSTAAEGGRRPHKGGPYRRAPLAALQQPAPTSFDSSMPMQVRRAHDHEQQGMRREMAALRLAACGRRQGSSGWPGASEALPWAFRYLLTHPDHNADSHRLPGGGNPQQQCRRASERQQAASAGSGSTHKQCRKRTKQRQRPQPSATAAAAARGGGGSGAGAVVAAACCSSRGRAQRWVDSSLN